MMPQLTLINECFFGLFEIDYLIHSNVHPEHETDSLPLMLLKIMNLKSIITRCPFVKKKIMKLSHPASIWIIHWKCLVLPNKTSPLLTQEPQEGKSALLRHPVSYNIEKYFLQNFFFLGGLDGVQSCFVPFRLGERQKERRGERG